ncbi:MAG: helix-hairpin-helix domain-containing protein [Methanocella sp.]
MSPEATSMDLEYVPGIGSKMAADLRSIGIFKTSDLKDRDPEQLYCDLEEKAGHHVDRCVLYTYRCAVYYASNERHNPEKLKWWNWKDK